MSGDHDLAYREDSYNTLFNGECLYDAEQTAAVLSISGLCRTTIRSGARSKELNEHLSQLPSMVNNILIEHDLAAKYESHAAFSFIGDHARETVGNIVSKVFRQWEIAMARKNYQTLLPGKDDSSKSLVIETAAAVMQVIGEVPEYRLETYPKDADRIAAVLANWGPKFTKQWFNKTILVQWMNRSGLSETEQSQWLEVFSPGVLKRIAEYYVTDPLNTLQRIKNNLDTYLTEEKIAAELGWYIDDVRAVFSPSVRKHFAVSNISNPLQATRKVKENLEVHLSNANIKKITGWNEEQIRNVFSPFILKRIAVHQINNPLKAVKKIKDNLETHLSDAAIAAATGLNEDQVRAVFVKSIRVFIATWYINSPLKGAAEWAKGNIKLGGALDQVKINKMHQYGLI